MPGQRTAPAPWGGRGGSRRRALEVAAALLELLAIGRGLACGVEDSTVEGHHHGLVLVVGVQGCLEGCVMAHVCLAGVDLGARGRHDVVGVEPA